VILALLFALACHEQKCARTGDIVACTCIPDEDAGYVVRIRRGGKTLYEARRDGIDFGGYDIEVFRKDLDGDGHAEIVACDLAGMSNGMSVQSWNLTILDGRTGAATVMPLNDYDKGLVQRPLIRITSWEWIGDHLYFIARPYTYRNGALHPAKEKGMWRRPYLFSFERERGQGGKPSVWLKRADHVAWSDPTPSP